MNNNTANKDAGSSRRGFVKGILTAGVAGLVLPSLMGSDSANAQAPVTGPAGAARPSSAPAPTPAPVRLKMMKPNFDNAVILFQGDSITDGNRGRNADLNHVMGHGYAFSVASRVGADFPEKELMFYNRGVSGGTVPSLEARWQTDTLDLQPDVLSILVGVNDQRVSIERYEQGYRSLLQRVLDQNPKALFVLCIPFVHPFLPRDQPTAEARIADMKQRQQVVRTIAKDFDTVLVDTAAVFDKAQKRAPIIYWLWDGVHPTVAGHELVTREWIAQTSQRVKFLKHYRY